MNRFALARPMRNAPSRRSVADRAGEFDLELRGVTGERMKTALENRSIGWPAALFGASNEYAGSIRDGSESLLRLFFSAAAECRP
jgi:hypothetical protein